MNRNKKATVLFIIITGAFWFYLKADNKKSHYTDSANKTSTSSRAISSTPTPKAPEKGKKVKRKLLPTTPIATYKNEQRLVHRKITSLSKVKKINKKATYAIGDHLILENYFAVKDTTENRLRFQKFESKLGYIIVASDQKPIDSLAVTQNKDSGALGIMTGIITVKLFDFGDYQNTISHSNFTVTNVYDDIKVVHFQIDTSELAISTYEALKNHPNIQRIKLEILEYSRFHR